MVGLRGLPGPALTRRTRPAPARLVEQGPLYLNVSRAVYHTVENKQEYSQASVR